MGSSGFPLRPTAALVAWAVLSMAGWAFSSPPAWLDRLPHRPDQYIGIGRADKRTHPTDYREAAQAAALGQISREISIQVRSETRSKVEEGPAGESETFTQAIHAISRSDLSGYELVDQYETGEALWVYYTLDKEVFQKAVEEEERKAEAWWARESAALDEELRTRRIGAAVARWNRLRKRVEGGKVDGSEWPEPFERMTTRLRGALGQVALRMEPSEWVLHGGQCAASGEVSRSGNAHSGGARAILLEGSGGTPWKGPLTLAVVGRGTPKDVPCKVETGPDGELDLEGLFQVCGMKPGTWKVTWDGPDGMRVHSEVKAKVVKAEWGLSVLAKGRVGGAGMAEDLKGELASRESLFFRWVPSGANRPQVEIEVRQAAVDSLEGVYFTTLRGTLRVPGSTSPQEVHGKAGHSNRAASRNRAIQDFAKNVMGILTIL